MPKLALPLPAAHFLLGAASVSLFPPRFDRAAFAREASELARAERVSPQAASEALLRARFLGQICLAILLFGLLAGTLSFALAGSEPLAIAAAVSFGLIWSGAQLLPRWISRR